MHVLWGVYQNLGTGIAVGAQHQVYLFGHMLEAFGFGSITTNASRDNFIAELSSKGHPLWIRIFPTGVLTEMGLLSHPNLAPGFVECFRGA